MEKLPDELVLHILDYLEPTEVIILQAVSRRLCKLARDNPLWRFQCYYDSPKVTIDRIGHKSWSQALAKSLVGGQQSSHGHTGLSNKARATDEWDLSDPSEKVDWYSEYIARHAQLSACWLSPQSTSQQDIRGIALLEGYGGKKLVGPLEDGSLGIWDIGRKEGGPSRHPHIYQKPVTSSPGILFCDSTATSESSKSSAKKALAFSGVTDCVSIDDARKRAYVAVGDLLSEVDINTLEVVKQTKYAWTITALSDIKSPHQPLTVGTSFSLHILDPRSPPRNSSHSPVGSADPTDSVAFFSNKDPKLNLQPARPLQIHPFNHPRPIVFDPQPQPQTAIPTASTQSRRSLTSYAQLEPAPLSILHQTAMSIMVAGRFPSILNYDRRYFPRLEYVIHSSARLSALAYLPFSPRGIRHSSTLTTSESQGTLIACGEYNGRGSLELYSVPHDDGVPIAIDDSSSNTPTFTTTARSDTTSANTQASSTSPSIRSFQNRQTISSAKLLSVATQGTRIVFSDADGGLKWVERDGRTIARRWNVNSYQLHRDAFPRVGRGSRGGQVGSGMFEAALHGEEVVRKIIPTGHGEADDLLVWTGERVGLVGFGRDEEEFYDAVEDGVGSGSVGVGVGRDDVVKSFDGFVGPRMAAASADGGGDANELEERAQEYDRQMRRALERQADELNWMQRFGFGNSP